MSSFMPTIKCSMCGGEIAISMMGEHACPPTTLDAHQSITQHDPISRRKLPPSHTTSITSMFFSKTGIRDPLLTVYRQVKPYGWSKKFSRYHEHSCNTDITIPCFATPFIWLQTDKITSFTRGTFSESGLSFPTIQTFTCFRWTR